MHNFRINPVLAALLCMLPPASFAEGDSLVLKPQQDLVAPQGKDLPVYIRGDMLQGHQGQDFEATGNAEARKGDQSIVADWLKYLQASDKIKAKGHVRLEQNGGIVTGPDLQLQLNTNLGFMTSPTYTMPQINARGHAERVDFAGKDQYKLHKAVYTTCPVGNDDWFMKVGELDLNQETQVGIAHDASLSFKGVPILYMPWLDFPTGSRRRSGFLAPIFGSTAAGGTEITVPYYINIAPNFDATVAPRLMAKRGMMLNNEFRYLEPGYSGQLDYNVLPQDAVTKTLRSELRFSHNQSFGHGLSGEVTIQKVSDPNYYLDLSPLVTMTSQTVLPREGHLSYDGGWWNLTTRVQNFQTLQNPLIPVVAPYAEAPQILLNGEKENLGGFDLKLTSEFDDFTHPILVNGRRLVFYPTLSYPMKTSSAFIIPKIGMHSVSYALGANNTTNLPNATVNIPVASVDSGLYFEKDHPFGRSDLLQTLEPRIFYVYVPYRNQNNLPIFDSAPLDFTYAQLFTENQFIGNDRFSDANEVTLALTSRFIQEDTGEERLRMSIAQRVYLQSPQLIPVTTSTSDVIASVGGAVNKTLSLDSSLQYTPNTSQVQFISMYAHYQPEFGKLLNFGYLYNRTILPLSTTVYGVSYAAALVNTLPAAVLAQGYALNQFDVSGQWPIYDKWHGLGRWSYSLANRQLLEGTAGVEYDADCWALRVVAKRFTIAYQMSATAFFVQLELDGLARIGPDPLDTLKTSIPGFTKTNVAPPSN